MRSVSQKLDNAIDRELKQVDNIGNIFDST